jgi:hypothetical protein
MERLIPPIREHLRTPALLADRRSVDEKGDQDPGSSGIPEEIAVRRSGVRAAEAPQGARGSAHLLAAKRRRAADGALVASSRKVPRRPKVPDEGTTDG